MQIKKKRERDLSFAELSKIPSTTTATVTSDLKPPATTTTTTAVGVHGDDDNDILVLQPPSKKNRMLSAMSKKKQIPETSSEEDLTNIISKYQRDLEELKHSIPSQEEEKSSWTSSDSLAPMVTQQLSEEDSALIEGIISWTCCSCGKHVQEDDPGAKLCPNCKSTITCSNCALKTCICSRCVMCESCYDLEPCGGCKRLMCGKSELMKSEELLTHHRDSPSTLRTSPILRRQSFSSNTCIGDCCFYCKDPYYCKACAPNYLDNCYNCHHNYCRNHFRGEESVACVSCFRDICGNCMDVVFKCDECQGPLCRHCEPDEKKSCRYCLRGACPNCDLTCECEQFMKQKKLEFQRAMKNDRINDQLYVDVIIRMPHQRNGKFGKK